MIQLSERALKSPKFFVWMPVFLSLVMIVLVAVPTLTGKFTDFLSPLSVDTDPESFLEYDEPARVTHREQKERFTIYDLMVVGIVNKTNEHGVFNPTTLNKIDDLTNYAKSLQWQDKNNQTVGVISAELISPSNVDNIEQGEAGSVNFDWLMSSPPTTQAEALKIREKIQKQPLLKGTLSSENAQALALYIPLTSKDVSYKISNLLKKRIAFYGGEDEFFITGLATAQDVFGVEMFQQMAIATPMAILLMVALLWFFFRNMRLILSTIIVANLAVIITMGLMIVTGHDIAIMSSMIPIFIMPISVLDGIHILSEFYDRYPQIKDRKQVIKRVMSELSLPMLLTSVTTASGFAALNLMPLPPIQDFGTFVCVGVIVAWALTMTLIPAYIMLIPEEKLKGFGGQHSRHPEGPTFLGRILQKIGRSSMRFAKPIVLLSILFVFASLYGINKLIPSDNPMMWFGSDHEIRKADLILNKEFSGSYMAYLWLKGDEPQVFKDPEMLRYLEGLQDDIQNAETVGKTTAVTEIIKTVHRELFAGDEKQYRIPDTREAVAETLMTFQGSHRPNDLWHYVTPDYQEAIVWFQLNSGDNQAMIKVEKRVEDYLLKNPPPTQLTHDWFGMTHLNVVWQERVTIGMVKACAGSFLIIMLTLMLLFRSFKWGLLAMVPLSFTVAVIYGATGFISGNLDTPLAILTAVSIGLSVDYAIHFITRSRQLRKKYSTWEETLPAVFGEPVRAITRNVIVVGIGFLPLLMTPLVPYQMTGIILSSILVLGGISTLIILPALIHLFEKSLFKDALIQSGLEKINLEGGKDEKSLQSAGS